MINISVVKNLMVRAGADFSGLYKETKRATQQMRDFQSNLSKTMSGIKVALAALGVGKFIKDSVSAAMQVEASIGQIGRIMGENSDEFLKWANSQSVAYGMAKSEALKYGSVYGNLISGFSNGTKETLTRTQDLLKASAVVASATGGTMEDTMDRIRSGLLGNTESIEDLGINVNISMIESTKAFRKFAGDKSWQQLDFQTQQQIRLYAILEQANTKYGNSIANNTMSAQQQFIAQLKNIQLSLGQAFLPIYQTILPALTSLASKIAYVANIFAQFMQALFGKAPAKAAATAASQQASAVSGLGDAYKGAGKAAKGALAGFDEINAISQPSGTGGAGGSETGALGAGANLANADATSEMGLPDVSGKIGEIANGVKTAVSGMYESVKPLLDTLGANIKTIYTEVLVPFGAWVATEVAPVAIDIISSAFKILNEALIALQPLSAWLLDNFLKPIAEWTGGAIVTTLQGLAAALRDIGTWMSENRETVSGAAIAVGAFMAAWKGMELMAFIQMSGGIVRAFKDITTAIKAGTLAKLANKAETIALTALYAKDFVAGLVMATGKIIADTAAWIANTATKVASTVATWAMVAATTAWNVIGTIATGVTTAFGVAMAILTSPITLVIAAIAAIIAIIVLLVKNWDKVRETAANVWQGIANVWKGVSSWLWNNVISPTIEFFKKWWPAILLVIAPFIGVPTIIMQNWNVIGPKMRELWNGIKSFLGGIWNGIKTTATTIFNGVRDGIVGAFESVKSKVLSIWDGIVGGIKSAINTVISAVNSFINGFNSIQISVPKVKVPLLGDVGGFSIGVPKIPNIPHLAKGGITNGEMLATIGDNPGGREVVSPLDDLKEMLAETMSQVLKQNQGNSGNQTLILKVGETELGRATINAINAAQRQAGVTLLAI